MVKLLLIIFNDEKKLKTLFKKYKLTFNVMTYGTGTASHRLLKKLGLDEVRKNIYFSLIPSNIEDILFNDLKSKFKIKEIGKGIALTIPLNSSSKYVSDMLIKGDIEMDDVDSCYELIITIVKDGYSDLVMQAAKKAGCKGGTVINARSLGSSRTIFMNLAIEPEKDLVLNIVSKKIASKVMEQIREEAGIKSDARGLIISLPIDKVIGLQDDKD